MAQTKDLIVTSNNTGGTKSYIRIGDLTGPDDVSTTGSSIQFLGNLSNPLTDNFDNQGNASAFRIRHDTVNGALIFEGRTNSVQKSLIQFQDQGTVKFTAPVTFQSIGFDDVIASQIYIGTRSTLLGTTSVSFLSLTSSVGTASIWYDGTQMHIDGFTSGGNSWKSEVKLLQTYISQSPYIIYTQSASQIVQNSNYLSVYLNGSLLIQSASTKPQWDYKLIPDVQTLEYTIQFRYNIPVVSGDDFYLTYVYNGGSN